jgi:hypothetical protein
MSLLKPLQEVTDMLLDLIIMLKLVASHQLLKQSKEMEITGT